MKMLSRAVAGLLAFFVCAAPVAAQQLQNPATSITGAEQFSALQPGNGYVALNVNQVGGYVSTTSPLARAQRILRAAARPYGDPSAALATAPTITFGSTTGASTVNNLATSPQVTTGSILINDARYVTPIGGPWAPSTQQTAPAMVIQTVTDALGRQPGVGTGFRFTFYGQAFDVSAYLGSTGLMCYVTDPVVGTRQRCRAADYTTTDYGNAGFRFVKWDFGSAALRTVEVYGGSSAAFGAINLAPNGTAIFNAREADQPRVAFLWDSWGAHVLTSGTNPIRLAVPDYVAQGLGVTNPLCASYGGTGFLATNSGSGKTYRQRIAAGDMDASRIGALDLIVMPTSVNDVNLVGNTPAALQAEIPLTIAALRLAQPGAIIIVTGPQYTTATTGAQTWYDASAAGVAAANDSDTIYIDNSPYGTGENWLNGTLTTGTDSVMFSIADNHVNDIGKIYYGRRMAASIIAAIRNKYLGPVSYGYDLPRAGNDSAAQQVAA